jgi:hypothetical protein
VAYTTTARWDSAITASHTMAVQVDVLNRNVPVLTLNTVTGGSVEVERTLIRRQASVTIVDPGDGSLIPNSPTDPLSVFGNEIRIWRGLAYPDGTQELVPIFTGPIAEVEEDWPVITVKAFDRADRVQRHRFEVPNVIGSGTNYIVAIQRVIETADPGVEFNFPATNLVTPQLMFEEQGDPWDAAKKMAASMGNELIFDAMGVCTMYSEPGATVTNPAFTFTEGDNAEFPELAARATLLGATRSRTNRGRFNKVIATGENTDNSAVYRVEAWDADPSSPTYIGGDFGVVPRWYASQFITSNAQAAGAARSVLQAELGQTDQIPFEVIPNPALDVGDPVRVIRTRAGIDTTRTIDKLSIPLDPGTAMPIVTRSQVTIEDDAG